MKNKKTDFLRPEQCCLYVIDPQERLMAHIYEAGRVIKNIDLLLRLADVFSLSVLANTQYKKGIGEFVPELQEQLAKVVCHDKVEFNGLDNQATRAELDNLPDSVDTLLLCGVETHICIYQTVKAALSAGYNVWVVADAVSSRTFENYQFGLTAIRHLGAVVVPVELIIYELLKKAGSPEFKAMLPYLK